MKYSIPLIATSFLAIIASSSFAHHSSAPHFDHDNPISVSGAFTEFRMVNPHAYIYFEVEENGEMVDWRCELSSATQLGRWGWSEDMFNVGQMLTIVGSPARREDHHCYMNTVTLSNGTEISRNGSIDGVRTAVTAEEAEQGERPLFLADGRSNIAGAWLTRSFGRGSAERIAPQFRATEAGDIAVGGYQMEFDDPILRCHPVNIFNGWNHDRHVNEIRVEEDQIILQYGFMDFVRTIHMDLDEHPDNIVPSTGGHSIGRWEGSTLIVDTVGFEEGVLSHQSGMKHSNEMHVVEHFRVDADTGYLVRDYYVTDPLYLVGETHGQDLMSPSDVGYSAYNCVELSGDNNTRPED